MYPQPISRRARRMTRRMKCRTAIAFTLLALSTASLLSPSVVNAASSHVAANLPPVDFTKGFANLVQAVKPAVVNISTTSTVSAGHNRPSFRGSPEMEEFFRRFFDDPGTSPRRERKSFPSERKTTAVGSGFIIDPEGLVVTNDHVIDGADEIEVVFDDGTRVPATLKGRDPKTDLALLEIATDKPLPYVKFGDSDSARVGDWVIAIGNPFGLGGTTTSGIISARARDIRAGDDFIQIDAPINRGNSGGPLFNTKGEVIGINSVIYSPNGGNVGIGFAIPSSTADNVIAQLRDSGVVQRGFLGVHIQTVSAEIADSLGLKKASGALVSRVVAASPAEKAGIEAGDIILIYDGKKVHKMRDLPKLVGLTKNETKVKIVIWRGEKRKTLRVSIGRNAEEQIALDKLADASPTSKLGLSVEALTAKNREQYDLDEDARGVVIVEVAPNSGATQRGLFAGALIKRADKTEVNSPADLQKAVTAARKAGKKTVLLLVQQGEHTRFVAVPLDAG